MISEVKRKPNQALIKELESVLEEVKNGDIQTLLMVGERADKTIDWLISTKESSKFEVAGYLLHLAIQGLT